MSSMIKRVKCGNTGGSCLSHTAVKLDSRLAHIFGQNKFHKFTRYGLSNKNWIIWITLKPDRFSCSQKIWLKQDPPVVKRIAILTGKTLIFIALNLEGGIFGQYRKLDM